MTTNEKSPAADAIRRHGEADAPAVPPSRRLHRRTIASRHVSVRASAHEFQMPAAQFSVSKYQLMPQTGTVAAMIGGERQPDLQAARERGGHRVAQLAHPDGHGQPPAEPPHDDAIDPGAAGVVAIELPAPRPPLDPSRRTPPQEVRRVDHEQREQHGDEHVAGNGHSGGDHRQQRQVGAHASQVDREERGDERERPATIDRRACPFGGFDLGGHRRGARIVGQPKLADHGLVGFGARVHRRDDDVPRDAEDPERAGQRDESSSRASLAPAESAARRRGWRAPPAR